MYLKKKKKKGETRHYVQALLGASVGFRLNASVWELEFELYSQWKAVLLNGKLFLLCSNVFINSMCCAVEQN